MSSIEFSKDNITLKRTDIVVGSKVRWEFVISGQTSDETQTFTLDKIADVENLKAIIGQVEHAAKVLQSGVTDDHKGGAYR